MRDLRDETAYWTAQSAARHLPTVAVSWWSRRALQAAGQRHLTRAQAARLLAVRGVLAERRADAERAAAVGRLLAPLLERSGA